MLESYLVIWVENTGYELEELSLPHELKEVIL